MTANKTANTAGARFGLGLATILAWTACLLAEASRTQSAVGAAACGVLFAVSLSSLGEWLIHALLYHRTVPGFAVVRRIHHHGHHFALFPPERYSKTDGHSFMNVRQPLVPFRMAENQISNLTTMLGQVALHFVAGIVLIIVPAWLFTNSEPFLFAALATMSAISWLLAYVHGAIHTRRQRWIERRWWFRWLDRHHYVHHVDLTANINFMLPLCDFLFGTRKAALDDDERRRYPLYEEASLTAPAGCTRLGDAREGRRGREDVVPPARSVSS